MKVVLVIGHKRIKPGACNDTNETCEFSFNETLVHEIANKIKSGEHEVEVVYREVYNKLPEKINALNPDLVVLFHCNAFNKKASGTETLYYHTSIKGEMIAKIFQRNIVKVLKLPDRGVKGKGTEDRGGFILRYTKAPCILIEPFFIDNDGDYKVVMGKYHSFVEACKLSIYEAFEDVIKEIK
jgi:N-acetylmuramoyl-L-alanine amidase